MTYNMTAIEESKNFYELYVAINDLSGGWLSLFILAVFFIIAFASFKRYEDDTKTVFVVCSTLITIISILFFAAELISWKILIYPIIMLFSSIVILKISD